MSQKKQIKITTLLGNADSSVEAESSKKGSRRRSLRETPSTSSTTPSILGRKRKDQSPSTMSTPQKRARMPLSVLEVTPEASIRNFLFNARRPKAMPANFKWANGDDLWTTLMRSNSHVASMSKILEQNPAFKPQMRAILLDWLIEVSEVYQLHRDTYYLAMNLFDRYLQATENLPKDQLQLVGVSCLFISGKMEEIYPPQINEYSYVSDGACEEREIIAKEMAILTKLKWDICPMTANNWLTLFLQLSQLQESAAGESEKKDLYVADICLQEFNICAQLLDLCTLDMESMNFPPQHLAASIVFHVLGVEEMERVSGVTVRDVEDCVQWVRPFSQTLREESPAKQGGTAEFNKQAYNVSLRLLEKAQTLKNQLAATALMKTPTSSRKRTALPESFMTPPSCSKTMRSENDENRL
ncbi:G1/S-specific cyclin-E1 [Galendromus occidentalis]|uniref:G1/S-specific cyclin-E1 n=1 Tax=Galendromus occidentalis TaxID=34638 RepID=A0AAJ6QYP7_9ACAR|nr:G1/S-specific cyclin-E1 [Galendromus occidentalis]